MWRLAVVGLPLVLLGCHPRDELPPGTGGAQDLAAPSADFGNPGYVDEGGLEMGGHSVDGSAGFDGGSDAGGPFGGSGNPQPPTTIPLFHIAANASTQIPGGDLGYAVTANGQGGYRVVWTDTGGSAAHFHGSIFCDHTFDQYAPFSAGTHLMMAAPNRIDFESTPGQGVDGVDLVPSTDPIYVDLLVDGSYTGFSIYFTNATTGQVSTVGPRGAPIDPVAFTSP